MRPYDRAPGATDPLSALQRAAAMLLPELRKWELHPNGEVGFEHYPGGGGKSDQKLTPFYR